MSILDVISKKSFLAKPQLLLLLLLVVLVGCSNTANNAGTASPSTDANTGSAATAAAAIDQPVKAGGTFIYGRPASVTSLDLHNQITANNAFAIDKVFESLLSFNSNGEIINWLAESHSVSEDNLTYTFVLRKGVKFSNGTEVTADDVVFSLNRHLEVGGPLAIAAKVEAVTAQDAHTIVIKLLEPYTPFIAELSNFSNGVLPKDFAGQSEEEFFKNPIGTGPFVVKEWDPSGDIVFTKNEHYWQEGKPYIDELVYKLIQDDSQAINQLKAGEVHAIESVALENVEELKKYNGVQVLQNGSWITEQVFFNTLNEHFSDVHVRRAIALALDREGLTNVVTFGNAEVAKSLLPSSIPNNANDTIKPLEFNVEAAKAELAKSKYPNGFSSTILIASGNNARAQSAQIIQAAAQSIGIELKIESVELASFRERFFAYNYAVMINSGQADAPEANSILAFQTDPNGFSKSYWTHYVNDKVTELLYAGQKSGNPEERKQIYAELQQILADEVPYIPLYYPNINKGVSDSIEGLVLLPNNSLRFEGVQIK